MFVCLFLACDRHSIETRRLCYEASVALIFLIILKFDNISYLLLDLVDSKLGVKSLP